MSTKTIEDYYLESLRTVSEVHAWLDAKRNAALACRHLGHVPVVSGQLGAKVEQGTCSRCLQVIVTTEQTSGTQNK